MVTLATTTDGPLMRTAKLGSTDWWNDSPAVAELTWAIERGAVGATSNPPIVLEVIGRERDHWAARVRALAAADGAATETELARNVVEEMGTRGAGLLASIHAESGGRRGWQSVQVDPRDEPVPERMVEQAVRFTSLAPNLQVKLPATAAGIRAMEEATARGVNVNATVSFSVAQVLAAADAIERGLVRYAAAGGDPERLAPVVVLMVGRLDDWLKVVAERDLLSITPGVLDWAGIAVFKRTWAILREREVRSRLLAAAFRHHLHWTELVGGAVSLTIPHAWQVRFERSGIEPAARLDQPVDPAILAELRTIPDFRRAYEPDGMEPSEFRGFGATARTLRGFSKAVHDLEAVVRDLVLPDPDLPAA
jgi:transaldolase